MIFPFRAINRLCLIAVIAYLGMGKSVDAQCLLQRCSLERSPPFLKLAKTTGFVGMDARLNEEANHLFGAFGVNPNLFLFDDLERPNAFASPQITLHGFTGTIYLGATLIERTISSEQLGEAALTIVMAHEWAHILQMKFGLPDQLSHPHREMHADVLAGWYMGLRDITAHSEASAVALRTFQDGGDSEAAVNSHGAPNARMEALLYGYQRSHRSLPEIYGSGLEFVREHL